MSGRRNFKEFRKAMTPDRRERNARAASRRVKAMLLSELRRAAGKTQIQLAGKMRVGQSAVSKLEGQADMQISTLRKIVEALGGELEIIASLPGGERVAVELP